MISYIDLYIRIIYYIIYMLVQQQQPENLTTQMQKMEIDIILQLTIFMLIL